MSFSIRNLAPVNASLCLVEIDPPLLQPLRGSPRMWTYATEDAQSAIDASGYFNDAYRLLEIGDLIYVVTVAGGAFSQAGFAIVNSKASGVIDVTNVTVLTTTDSD